MINLEQETIRHIVLDFSAVRRENISPGLFEFEELDDYTLLTKSVLAWAYDYWEQHHKEPSAVVLNEEFDGVESDGEAPETDVVYLAERLKKRYAKYAQRKITLELADADADEFSEKYVAGTRKIFQLLSSNNCSVTEDGVYSVIEYQKNRVEEDKTLGVSMGFKLMDDHTGGVRPGQLAVLAALPKRQKTWVFVNAFLSQLRNGDRPAFHSLELTKEELVGRVLCLMSGVSYHRYYRGLCLPHEWAKIEEAAKEYASLGGAVIQLPFGNRFVSSLLLEAERFGATSLIIDQFSYIQWSGQHYRENEGYKEIVYDLKNNALNYDLPIFMAAQLNRESGIDEDKFPVAQHLGLTRALEEVSDIIMGIKSNDALKEEHRIMIGVVEARHCESGPKARWTIEYEFYTETNFEMSEIDR